MGNPISKIKQGKLTASFWKGEFGVSITIQKSYKTKDGEWKNTDFINQYDFADLLALATKVVMYNTPVNAVETKEEEPPF